MEKKTWVLIGVTVFCWAYYFTKGRLIEWWQMLIFNVIMILGILKVMNEGEE